MAEKRRGRSTFVSYGQRAGEMLNDAGRALIEDERFRLLVMEVAGEPIAADIYIAGGGAVNGISGGWDVIAVTRPNRCLSIPGGRNCEDHWSRHVPSDRT